MMKTPTINAIVILLLLLTACAPSPTSNDVPVQSGAPELAYRKISPQEAKTLMDETEDFILLDVRTEEEFLDSHIPGAKLLPGDEIANRVASALPDKNAHILVYCRSGVRSAAAAKVLLDMGYANVFDIGGIIDWPYETAGG